MKEFKEFKEFKNISHAKKQLLYVLARIQNCWEHHQDGSDLRKTHSSHLFGLIFNDLKTAIKEDRIESIMLSRKLLKNEEEDIKQTIKNYSFKKLLEEIEKIGEKNKTTKDPSTLVKELRAMEKMKNLYKRDSEKYLAMLTTKKICPDCGTTDAPCDCPFG